MVTWQRRNGHQRNRRVDDIATIIISLPQHIIWISCEKQSNYSIHRGYRAGRQNACRPTALKMGPCRIAKPKEPHKFQKLQGCPYCSVASMVGWTLTVTSGATTFVQSEAWLWWVQDYKSCTKHDFRKPFGTETIMLCFCPKTISKVPTSTWHGRKTAKNICKATKHGFPCRIDLSAKLPRICT